MLEGTRKAQAALLNFTFTEWEFLDRLLDDGEIDASFLTENEEMQALIHDQPRLHWKAQNVRDYKLD